MMRPVAGGALRRSLRLLQVDTDTTVQRKMDHINICKNRPIEPVSCPLDRYRLPFRCLPEVDLGAVSLKTEFFGWEVEAPLVVSSMTGGEAHGETINRNVATACNAEGVPFGLGSMRVINRYPETVKTFDVKKYAPDVPMFANVGLVQLNYGFGLKEVLNIIESVKADGLFIHINPLQEAVQPEGDVNFKGLVAKLAEILPHIPVPVVAKEVGHGIDVESALLLRNARVEVVDVAGVGGSSWAWIEGYRQPDYDAQEHENLGYVMRSVGIPSDEAITACSGVKGLKVIAGGGLRNGLQMAKALCLGADYVTCAKPFLAAAMDSPEAVQKVIRRYKKEMQVALFSTGSSSVEELQQLKDKLIKE